MPTVAAVIIGDEILSGKVRDSNTPLVVELCAAAGAELRRVVLLGDDPRAIAEEVAASSAAHDVVITSGGLGPTHDDRTVAAVAAAFGVEVVRSPEVAALIRSLWGRRFTEAALRMADMPAGGRLLWADDGLLPLVAIDNVYLLPGVPELFAAKLPTLRGLVAGEALLRHGVYLSSDESRVAPLLEEVDRAHPEVAIGSYPRFHGGDHRLWVTIEGRDRAAVDRALEALLGLLPAAEVVRVEHGEVETDGASGQM